LFKVSFIAAVKSATSSCTTRSVAPRNKAELVWK
jgi:hypothetical protein